ncbi:transcription factor Adf-1-like [Ornithodoros turicata]|uniref:transcription factor Adf-1-like n=1 Tax=Ornithodoros turicata TaxID=34597 RepID=UPI003139B1BD
MAASSELGDQVQALSADVVEKLIEAVRQHPCVYDTKRMEYRDQMRKNNAWEIIRSSCGLRTADECQKIWKRLRDRYSREQKAVEVTQASGSGFVPRRTWEYFQAMEFYKDCGRPRKTVSNLEVPGPGCNGPDDHTNTVQPTAAFILNSIVRGEASHTPPPLMDSAPSDTEASSRPVETVPTTVEREGISRQQKKRRSNTEAFEEQLLCRLDKKISENEAFGLSVGMSLDRLPTRQASQCKAKIMALIAEYDE